MSLRGILGPKLSWAFPTGAHHQLIVAAIGTNERQSLDAAHSWLAANNIDAASFREQRLLLAITARFGQQLQGHSAYPRLVGLQRLLWTRSLMALQEAKPALERVADAGIEMLLIKGASRLAVQPSAGKHRVAHDIDVVVKPESMRRAFDILVAENWMPAPGSSSQYIREHLASTRSINLFKANFGDIDLHSRAFHPGQGGDSEDSKLWASARPATLGGIDVLVPKPEDRIALAIAHGGLDGHAHSDWLIDCAVILKAESIDWQELQRIVLSRQIEASAAIAFRYMKDSIGLFFPEAFLCALEAAAVANPIQLLFGLIQSRPKERSGLFGQMLRGLVKAQRKDSGAAQLPTRTSDRFLEAKRTLDSRAVKVGAPSRDSFVESYRLSLPPECERKQDLELDILLEILPPPSRRRIEMEINSARSHFCRIRFRKLTRSDAPLRLRVSGSIKNLPPGEALMLVSRPGKQLRSFSSKSERQRYQGLPFRVLSCRVAAIGCSASVG